MSRASRPPQDRQMIKRTVRATLQGRVFRSFLVCLIPNILTFVLRLFPFGDPALIFAVTDYNILYTISLPLQVISVLATLMVANPMAVRVSAHFLAFNRTPDNLPSPLAVCDCFGPGYFRLVQSMFLRTALVTVCAAVPIVIGALIPGTWSEIMVPTARIGVDLPAIKLHDSALIFILLSVAVNLYLSLAYTMVPYVLADEPGLRPMEVLRRSRALTRGRLWELFMLELSFFGWMFFVTFTMMFGAIYVYPYIEATMAAYYINFSKPMPWEENTLRAA